VTQGAGGAAQRRFHLDLPHLERVPHAYRTGTFDFARAVGQNIGNLAFRHGLEFILRDIADYERYHFRDLKAVNAGAQVHHSVLSCANWLGTGKASEDMNALRIRALRLIDGPLVCFGLGVQASLEEGAGVALGPHTRRLAAILSERSLCLGLRDETTQIVLADLGITNTVVMGCPSNFINCDPDLGAGIAALAAARAADAPAWTTTRSLISEYVPGHPAAVQVMAQKLHLMATSPAFYAIQTPVLMPFLFQENAEVPPRYTAAAPAGMTAAQLYNVMQAKTLHFSSVEGWMDMARTCQLSFGMRIHGTMLPLQAGVPSVLVRHDARTAGLAHSMAIPSLPPDAFIDSAASGPGALFAQIAQQMEEYDARRADLARVMLEFVRSHGLAPHDGLVTLAQGV
jgi:hypothetical protein